MKKIFLFFIICLIFSAPVLAQAQQPLVPCGNSPGPGVDASTTRPCQIQDFFTMLLRIFNFIVWWIATPLAIIMLTVGGIIMMLGAMNPNLFTLGKNTLWTAIIGLALVFGAWVIINFILGALGYKGNWNILY